MSKVKVTTSDKLQQEIARLQKRTRKLETELGDRVDFLKGNYKKMALNAVIPGGSKHTGLLSMAGHVAKIAWESGKFKTFATSSIVRALEFAGVRVGVNLFDKFRKARSNKKKKSKVAETEED